MLHVRRRRWNWSPWLLFFSGHELNLFSLSESVNFMSIYFSKLEQTRCLFNFRTFEITIVKKDEFLRLVRGYSLCGYTFIGSVGVYRCSIIDNKSRLHSIKLKTKFVSKKHLIIFSR